MDTEDIIALLNTQFTTLSSELKASTSATASLAGRMQTLEQAYAQGLRAGGGGPARAETWGTQFANSDRLKAFKTEGLRGSAQVTIKNEITTPSGIDQPGLVAPDRQPIQGLPQQVLRVRDLLPAVPTISNMIQYVKQISRANAAAPVAPGAQKPESDMGLELAEAPVRTIAHWIPVTRQTFEDVGGLAALIDSELRFGLRLEEEKQLLIGDGTGQNILGLIPQALPFVAPFEVAHQNPLDLILGAIVQAQQSRLPCDAVVVNDITWAQLLSLKDDQGRYLSGTGGGPFGQIPGLIWQVKVVPTPSLHRGECLVGSFQLGARLHDRMEVEVLASSEDRDNFIKNMITLRAEERTALAVRVPDSFVFIDELGMGLSG